MFYGGRWRTHEQIKSDVSHRGPVKDKSSDKYPERSFYAGRWRTPEQIAVYDISNQRYKQSEKGRATRREIESKRHRIRVFGAKVTLPDAEFKEFALRLREERRNARTEI